MPTLTLQRCSGTPIKLQISDHDFENETLRTVLPIIAAELENILRDEFKRGEIKYFRGAVPIKFLKFINLAFSNSPSDSGFGEETTAATAAAAADPFISLDTQLCEIDFENIRLMVQERSDEEQANLNANLNEACSALERKQRQGLEEMRKVDYRDAYNFEMNQRAREGRISLDRISLFKTFHCPTTRLRHGKCIFPTNKLHAQTDWYCKEVQNEIFKVALRRENTAWDCFDPFGNVLEPVPHDRKTIGDALSESSIERVRELLYLMPPEIFHSNSFLYVCSVGPHHRHSNNHVRRGSILDWICSVCHMVPNEALFGVVWDYLKDSGGTMDGVIRLLSGDGQVGDRLQNASVEGHVENVDEAASQNDEDNNFTEIGLQEFGPVLNPLRKLITVFGEFSAKVVIDVLEEGGGSLEESHVKTFFQSPFHDTQFWLPEIYGKMPMGEESYLKKLTDYMWSHPMFDAESELGSGVLFRLIAMGEGGQRAFVEQLSQKQKLLPMFQGKHQGLDVLVWLLLKSECSEQLLELIMHGDDIISSEIKEFAFDSIFQIPYPCEAEIKRIAFSEASKNTYKEQVLALYSERAVSAFQQCLIMTMVSGHGCSSYYGPSAFKRMKNLVEKILRAAPERAAKEFEKGQESIGFKAHIHRHLPEKFLQTIETDINERGYISLEKYAILAREHILKELKRFEHGDNETEAIDSGTKNVLVLFFESVESAVKGSRPLDGPVIVTPSETEADADLSVRVRDAEKSVRVQDAEKSLAKTLDFSEDVTILQFFMFLFKLLLQLTIIGCICMKDVFVSICWNEESKSSESNTDTESLANDNLDASGGVTNDDIDANSGGVTNDNVDADGGVITNTGEESYDSIIDSSRRMRMKNFDASVSGSGGRSFDDDRDSIGTCENSTGNVQQYDPEMDLPVSSPSSLSTAGNTGVVENDSDKSSSIRSPVPTSNNRSLENLDEIVDRSEFMKGYYIFPNTNAEHFQEFAIISYEEYLELVKQHDGVAPWLIGSEA